MSNVLKDRRHPGYVKHELVQLLTQRVFQIAPVMKMPMILMI